MKSKRKSVAVIFGGVGFEHEVSVRGADFILKNIDRCAYEPIAVYITRLGGWRICDKRGTASDAMLGKSVSKQTFPVCINGKSGLAIGKRIKRIDAAIPLLHGDGGEDGRVQSTLSTAGIKCAGECAEVSSLALDKAYTKIVAEHVGVPTVPFVMRYEPIPSSPSVAEAMAEAEHLGYPLFIKPRCLGSSVGCSLIKHPGEFERAYRRASSLGGGKVIIEAYLENIREVECAYISHFGKDLFTSVGEIECSDDFYSFNDKYSSASSAKVITCAEVSPEINRQIKEYSRRLKDALMVRSLSRFDFFVKDTKVFFNEVNTMPGMTPTSLFPKMLKSHGLSPKDMISALIEAAV